MEESIYKLKKANQLQLFTSNKDVIYPRLKKIVEGCFSIKKYPQKYWLLTVKLMNITEQLERIVSRRRKYRLG